MLTVTVGGRSSIIDTFLVPTAAHSQDTVANGALAKFLKTLLKVLPPIR